MFFGMKSVLCESFFPALLFLIGSGIRTLPSSIKLAIIAGLHDKHTQSSRVAAESKAELCLQIRLLHFHFSAQFYTAGKTQSQ